MIRESMAIEDLLPSGKAILSSQFDVDERLGRGVFESRQASRKNPRVRFYKVAFAAGPMSVDRLDNGDVTLLRELHDREAVQRESVNTFFGEYFLWMVFFSRRSRHFIRNECQP